MSKRLVLPGLITAVTTAMLLVAAPRDAKAQNSSLLGAAARGGRLVRNEHSWTYEQPPEKRKRQLHDIITILVK